MDSTKELGEARLTADDVAKMLNVSRQRVYELVRKKVFPLGVVVPLGERQIRFNGESLRLWISNGGRLPSKSIEAEEEPARNAA